MIKICTAHPAQEYKTHENLPHNKSHASSPPTTHANLHPTTNINDAALNAMAKSAKKQQQMIENLNKRVTELQEASNNTQASSAMLILELRKALATAQTSLKIAVEEKALAINAAEAKQKLFEEQIAVKNDALLKSNAKIEWLRTVVETRLIGYAWNSVKVCQDSGFCDEITFRDYQEHAVQITKELTEEGHKRGIVFKHPTT